MFSWNFDCMRYTKADFPAWNLSQICYFIISLFHHKSWLKKRVNWGNVDKKLFSSWVDSLITCTLVKLNRRVERISLIVFDVIVVPNLTYNASGDSKTNYSKSLNEQWGNTCQSLGQHANDKVERSMFPVKKKNWHPCLYNGVCSAHFSCYLLEWVATTICLAICIVSTDVVDDDFCRRPVGNKTYTAHRA